jgi:hypothetical protein
MANKKSSAASSNGYVVLSDVASLFRLPPTLKSEETASPVKIKVVTAYDIHDDGFAETTSKVMALSKTTMDKTKKFLLEPYDVVISAAGTIGKTAIISENLKGKTFPITTLLVIRFPEKKKEQAQALYLYLNSASGRKVVKKMTTGSSINILNIGTMAKMKIPALTPEVKKKASAVFRKVQTMHKSISETRNQILSAVSQYW